MLSSSLSSNIFWRTLTHHWPENLPSTEVAEEPKARLCFQLSTASKLHLTAQISFLDYIICLGATICSYITYAFAMWHLSPVREHILMHNGFFSISVSFLEIKNWGVHDVHLMLFLWIYLFSKCISPLWIQGRHKLVSVKVLIEGLFPSEELLALNMYRLKKEDP